MNLRDVNIGDILPPDFLVPERTRRLAAIAAVLPGRAPIGSYLADLAGAAADFSAWDGRVLPFEPDGVQAHRVVIIDRYGQVYDVTDAADAAQLPDARALEEWFKFLATACPECGVLDDPIASGPVP